ncbi:MAG: single-stranded DNA-binding protein [Planctomycetota bacterium]|jgi:single-strand DNA-binding protein|nr:single-stranded DNA-binding protein [Planctomycetota bacterium]
MYGFNKVILIGNLTRDPELRYTPQGTAVADLRIAVTTMRGRAGADRNKETLFIDCTVWDRQAEACNEYLTKGRPILVEGRLIEDQWQDKETGDRRSRIKVYVQSVQFLGGKGEDATGTSGRFESGRFEAPSSAAAAPGESERRPASPRSGAKPATPPAATPGDAFDEDIPSSTSSNEDIPF